MEFLEAARGDQPFFLVVDNYDPHEPWDPPEKYTSLYDEGYDGPEPWTSSSGPSRLAHRAPATADARALRR